MTPAADDSRRRRAEPTTLAALAAALTVGGGGGFLSYRDLSAQLATQSSKLEAVQALMAEVRSELGVIKAGGHESRLRLLEQGAAERGALLRIHDERIRRLEERGK